MLVTLLVAVLIIGLLVYLVQLFPIAQPFKNVALCIVILIAILWLLGFAGYFGPGPWHPVRPC
jgi:hypothetical protein